MTGVGFSLRSQYATTCIEFDVVTIRSEVDIAGLWSFAVHGHSDLQTTLRVEPVHKTAEKTRTDVLDANNRHREIRR